MSNSTTINPVFGAGMEFLWKARILFYLVSPGEIAFESLEQLNGQPSIVDQAIPYFILMIVLEGIIGFMRGVQLYRLNDASMSLNLGTVQQCLDMWTTTFRVAAYVYVYDNYRLIDLEPTSLITYVACILFCDFSYYWLHRFCHESHLGWATHSVHHSGEDYNLATALRQGSFQWVFGFFFKLPLALFLHPVPVIIHMGLNLIYQFWIHTQIVGHLGILEYVLNTASHHRVHHIPGKNCNYAGLLIIWDRMFGTFTPETFQKDAYGLGKTFESFDPVSANFRQFFRLQRNYPKDSWLQLAFRRRVRHPMVFDPLAVLQPLSSSLSKGDKEIGNLWELPSTPHLSRGRGTKYDGQNPKANKWSIWFYRLFLQIEITFSFLVLGEMMKHGYISPSLNLKGLGLLAFQTGLLLTCSALGFINDLSLTPKCVSFNLFRLVIILFVMSTLPCALHHIWNVPGGFELWEEQFLLGLGLKLYGMDLIFFGIVSFLEYKDHLQINKQD